MEEEEEKEEQDCCSSFEGEEEFGGKCSDKSDGCSLQTSRDILSAEKDRVRERETELWGFRTRNVLDLH